MDTGAKSETVAEKDLTLELARKLRTAIQTRFGATVILTRDSDIEMDNETRSAAANNNQANLFISLHAGFSSDKSAASSSIFVMSDNFVNSNTQIESAGSATRSRSLNSANQLFPPWYLGYRSSRNASEQAAKMLQEELRA